MKPRADTTRLIGRRVLGLALAVPLLIIGSGHELRVARAQVDFDQVAAATVMIAALVLEVQDGDPIREFQQVPLGSGILVSNDGLVLTNSHVIDLTSLHNDVEMLENAQGIDLAIEDAFVIHVVDGRNDIPSPRYSGQVAVNQPSRDLAVLAITGDERGSPLSRPVAADRSAVPLAPPGPIGSGAVVHIFGYPVFGREAFADATDETIDFVSGHVRALEMGPGIGNVDLIRINATVSSGSSGGAVVDDSGRLVGVVTEAQGAAAGGSVAAAIPIDRARPALEEAGWTEPTSELTPVPFPTASPAPPPATLTQTPPTVADFDAATLGGIVVFSAKVGAQWDLYSYDVALGQSMHLTGLPESDEWAPAFSHGGRRLAYLSDTTGTTQVWTMDSLGAEPRQVTYYEGPDEIYYVAWSSDDQRLIVTIRNPAREARLMSVPVQGGLLREYWPASSGYATQATNGRWAFVTWAGSETDIYGVSPDGTSYPLAVTAEDEDVPNIDQSGTWVAYNAGTKGSRRIQIVPATGGEPTILPQFSPDDSNPVWSPDGSALAIVATTGEWDEVWIVPLSGGEPQLLDLPSRDRLWYLTWAE